MTAFFDLFLRNPSRLEPEADPTCADPEFVKTLAGSPFRLWRPGDSVSPHGERLLLGVATWSGYDMRLPDVMAEGLSRGPRRSSYWLGATGMGGRGSGG